MEYEYGLFLVTGERDPSTIDTTETMTEWQAEVRNKSLMESRSPRYWHKLEAEEEWPCPKCNGRIGHRINCPDGVAFSTA